MPHIPYQELKGLDPQLSEEQGCLTTAGRAGCGLYPTYLPACGRLSAGAHTPQEWQSVTRMPQQAACTHVVCREV